MKKEGSYADLELVKLHQRLDQICESIAEKKI